MNVERTIEFLLAEGARLDARQHQFDQQLRRMALMGQRAYRQLSASLARLDEGQRQIQTNMLELQANTRELQANTRELQAGARRTEANLDALRQIVERHVTDQGAHGR